MNNVTIYFARILSGMALMLMIGLGAGPALALSLVPIAQDFSPSGRDTVQTFRLDNETNDQVAVTVKVLTRDLSLDGQESNAENRDFLVFPANVLLAPRQSQVVRVQWRGTATPGRELAYRIVAEQLALRRSLAPNARAIQIVVRYVGSLYVLPQGARSDVVVESAREINNSQVGRALELILHNKGKSHTLLDEPVLAMTVAGTTRTFRTGQLKVLEGENILAESRRRFFIPWPRELPFGKPSVEFKHTPLR